MTYTRREYLKSSFISVRDILYHIEAEKLKLPTWKRAYEDSDASSENTSRIPDLKCLQRRLKKTISDVISANKRLEEVGSSKLSGTV